MSASQFASFAAYLSEHRQTPPPDEHEQLSVPSGTTKASSSWLHSDPPENSYQSGIIPTLHSDAFTGSTLVPARQLIQSQWETRYGWRVDILAACSYILGPISALLLLIVETHNDYVRFHAYQSALLTTPLLTFRVVLSLAQFPRWLQSLCTVFILSLQCYMSLRAYRDASDHNLSIFYVPFIGHLAETWLAEE